MTKVKYLSLNIVNNYMRRGKNVWINVDADGQLICFDKYIC